MRVVQEVITPARAEQMLLLNTSNRPINKSHLQHLVREMREGRWMMNGDTITLNGKILIDGQHRLQAVVESGTSQKMLVVYDAPTECFSTKDQGRKRQPGDILHIHGVAGSRNVAATLRVVCIYEGGATASAFASAKNPMPATEIISQYEAHPGIDGSSLVGERVWMVRPSHAGALHYLMSRIDRPAADKFFDGIVNGSGSIKVNALRERLMKNKSTRGQSLSTVTVAAFIIKTWNAVRQNKNIAILKHVQGSDSFPDIL